MPVRSGMATGRSLRVRLVAPVVVLVVFMGVTLQAVLIQQLEHQSRDFARDRALDVARVLSSALQAPVEFDDTAGIVAALQPLRRAEGAAYAVVVNAAGKTLGLVSVDGTPPRVGLEAGAVDDSGGILHAAVQIPSIDALGTARLVVGFTTGAREVRVNETRTSVFSLTVLLVVIGATAAFVIGSRLARPIEKLSSTTARIIDERDLRIIIDADSDDEIGKLARAIADLVADQRRSLAGVTRLAHEVGVVSARVDEAGAQVKQEAQQIGTQVEVTAGTVREVREALHRGDSGTREVLGAAGQVSTILLDVNRANDQVAGTLHQLAAEGHATATSVGVMLQAAEQSRQRLAESDKALERASASMKRVEQAAHEVERSTAQTRDLSLRMRSGAGDGRTLIVEMQAGVDEMGRAIDEVRHSIEGLANRTSQIDVAVQVIQEVADQTALLSLNAAIIAAQAGEHGRGFGVVAASIKDLSDRTRVTVTTIAQVVAEVRGGADDAVAAVGRSRGAMRDGSRRSHQATVALEAILTDTASATERLEEMAGLTAEQLKGVRAVAQALAGVSETMAHIRNSGRSQEQAAKQLQGTAKDLIQLATSADETLIGHADRSAAAAQALARLRSIVQTLGGSQIQQAKLLETVLDDVEGIADAGGRQQGPVQDLVNAIALLRASAASLESESRRFQV